MIYIVDIFLQDIRHNRTFYCIGDTTILVKKMQLICC